VAAVTESHEVQWENLYMDMDPSVFSRPFATTRVPTGACELTCSCGWHELVPTDKVETAIAEHEQLNNLYSE
jgi:hypothetical protein